MLVVAPLRVCQLVWRQEGRCWTDFRDLRFSFLHGPKKEERLKDDADIWLINPEGAQWLSKLFFGRAIPFDTVTFDQLIRFKNARGERAKAMRARLRGVQRRWGLEGSLAPNGYMDLFGQMMMLDDGAALGKYITHYRDMYFDAGYTGFDYALRKGAAQRIEERIKPYVYRLPYTEKPPLRDNIVRVELEPAERKLYNEMKRNMLVEIGGETVTAANAAAVYGKLKQLANGAVYTGVAKEWVHVHDAKLNALEELIEELGNVKTETGRRVGNPVLIGYEFRHDLARLLTRFPDMCSFDGLGERDAVELERAWNNNELPYLAAHPASIGHGLNLQKGGAHHVAWFSATIDLNLYEEFIGRLVRRGNVAGEVTNHIIVANDTIDDTLTLPTLEDKAITQNTLLARLAQTLEIPAAGSAAVNEKESDMVFKLSRQGAAAPAAGAPTPNVATGSNTAVPAKVTPRGWGAPTEAADAPKGVLGRVINQPQADHGRVIEQTQAVTRRISGHPEDRGEEALAEEQPPASVRAAEAFSPDVRRQLQAPPGEADQMAAQADAGADGKPAPVRRARTPKPAAEVSQAAIDTPVIVEREVRDRALSYALRYVEYASGYDVLAVAKEFLDFLTGKAQP